MGHRLNTAFDAPMSKQVKYATLADLAVPADSPVRGQPTEQTTYSELVHSSFVVLDNDGNPFVKRRIFDQGADLFQEEVPKAARLGCYCSKEKHIRSIPRRGL
jgi:hypothetical protein